MADVARLAGVSPMTVSRAFKADGLISNETRGTILRAAEQLGYIFDSTASNFRSQKSDFVAVIVPSIDNANFAQTVGGLNTRLSSLNFQILLGNTNYDIAEEERLIEQLLRRRPQAIVVTGGKHTPRARRLLAGAGIPVVETWDRPSDPVGYYVGFSNTDAIYSMVSHFIDAGCRRIAFIGGDQAGDARGAERRRGFESAMKEFGLDVNRLIPAGSPPISMREGAAAMAELLDTYPDTQGVICVSDLSAFGALSECRRRGISVPDQFAIGGFGNYEISEVCVPSITTIDAFAYEIGEKAAMLIINLLEGNASTDNILIEPRLIIRASTRHAGLQAR
jgi:LacI family gluconate utilization system Gnt-I transcriptional repressor